MSVWFAALMGLVQGLTEFLPVSSSGHLVLIHSWFGADIEHDYMLFDILLHLGTLVSVFICFWPDIKALILEFIRFVPDLLSGKPQINKNPVRRMGIMLIIATLPMVIMPFINDKIEVLFTSPQIVGLMLLVTSVMLLVGDRLGGGKKKAATATWKDALIIGIMQLFAVIPGISRSGTAMTGGKIRGFTQKFAVKFSFLMSIPVIIGANIFSIADALQESFDPALLLPYGVGIVIAAISGICAIQMVRMIARKTNFRAFSIYCAILGIITIITGFIK